MVELGKLIGVQRAQISKLENNPGINVSTIKSFLNISRRTIERWINQLKKENKIEFKVAPAPQSLLTLRMRFSVSDWH
jgi:predicted transcriptional regulator